MAAGKNIAGDPYERLANGIILQAVSDYRMALKKIKANTRNRDALNEALEIERFFRSDWYRELTDVDGEYLIQRLQDEVKQYEPVRGKKKREAVYEQIPAGS